MVTVTVRSRGLGDTVRKITTAIGIANVVSIVAAALNVDCGCEERRKKLNELFPYCVDTGITTEQ